MVYSKCTTLKLSTSQYSADFKFKVVAFLNIVLNSENKRRKYKKYFYLTIVEVQATIIKLFNL